MKNLLYILILSIFSSCNLGKVDRPKNVPEDAIWKGGADGGCWIQFQSVKDNYIEAVIFQKDGAVWDKGIFNKVGDCKMNKPNFINEITAFDGKRLLTSKSCFFSK